MEPWLKSFLEKAARDSHLLQHHNAHAAVSARCTLLAELLGWREEWFEALDAEDGDEQNV